ncbi:UNVERIFIED_CONTAM: DNA-binding protein [Euhalothece sp. KZN 001]
MSRQLERLLHIDAFLRYQQRQTSDTLAEALEVSERTIRKDLAFLRDRYHAPLEFTKKEGWHYTDSQWRLPSVALSKGELFALTLGARMLEAYVGSPYEGELRSSIQRLANRLPEKIRINLEQLADERIVFRTGAKMMNLNPQVWEELERACHHSQKVWIRYYAASKNEESERVIDPYLIDIYRGSNPYVIAFCNKRQDFRDFRIDRIRELKVLDESFQRDPSFNPEEYLASRFQYERGNQSFSVAIWFDPATAPFIRERRWHITQDIEENADGSLILRMDVPGLNDLKRWVLGYGKGAMVLEPPELVQLMTKEVEAIQKFYDS